MQTCVSLRTCQAVDHSFPPLALSLCFHTQFFFFFATPQTQGFLVRPDRGLIYCTVELWEGRASQHKVANGSQPPCWWWCCFMSPADVGWFVLREKLWRARLWYALSPAWRSKHWTSVKKEKTNKERRASVSSAALRTELRLAVRSRWPGPTDVLGLSAGSAPDHLREHDT